MNIVKSEFTHYKNHTIQTTILKTRTYYGIDFDGYEKEYSKISSAKIAISKLKTLKPWLDFNCRS